MRLTLAVEVVLLAVLAAMACATPVDPLGITGIYDGGDYDDAVGVLLDDCVALGSGARIADATTSAGRRLAPRAPTPLRAESHFYSRHLRSPPPRERPSSKITL